MREYMEQIVGNKALRTRLCEYALSDKLPHAVILEGRRGTGKHTLAWYTAAALACSSKDADVGSFPCGTCRECKKVLEKKSPDVTVVGCGGKATLGVDAVRFLREDVRTVPNDLDFKLYVIEDADKMTTQAQNALLLTLEEPPKYVRFILLCESAEALLETVRSRAPVMRTEPVSNEELDSYICKRDRRAAQMKLTSPREYAELIAASKNGIGSALEYLEPKVFAPVAEARAFICQFLDTATDGASARKIFPLLARFSQKREVFAERLSCLCEAVTDLLLLKKSDTATLTFFSDRDFAVELCDRVSASFLYTLNTAVMTAAENNSRNANVRLTVLKMASDAGLI